MGEVQKDNTRLKKERSLSKICGSDTSKKANRGFVSPSNKKSPKPVVTQTNTISTWLSKKYIKIEKSKTDRSDECSEQEPEKSSHNLHHMKEYSSDSSGKSVIKIKNHGDQLLAINEAKDECAKKKWKKLAALGQLGDTNAEDKITWSSKNSTNISKHKISKMNNTEDLKENLDSCKPAKRRRQHEKKHKKIKPDTKQRKLDSLNMTPTKQKKEGGISPRGSPRNRESPIPPTRTVTKYKITTEEFENTIGAIHVKHNDVNRLSITHTKQNDGEIVSLRSPRNRKLPVPFTRTVTKCKKNITEEFGNTVGVAEAENFEKKSEQREKESVPRRQKLDCLVDKNHHTKCNTDKHVSNSREKEKESGSDHHRKKHKKQITERDKIISKVTLEKDSKHRKKRSKTKSEIGDGISNSHRRQEKLDSFVIKTSRQKVDSKKTKFTRTESSESCDFPSFENLNKKSKGSKSSESFKKYGVALPSIEEILKEQKDLQLYRQQIEAFQDIEHQSFELPFSIKDLNISPECCQNVLGCKDLSVEDITHAFKKNLNYAADIFYGKKYSERHERFFKNKNKSYTLSFKDLTCSTSMIVFSYDQIEHMIKLLKEEFDPEDKWTPYFFQVLLPELCLKIFMDTHEMTYEEAVKYLDTRPIVDD